MKTKNVKIHEFDSDLFAVIVERGDIVTFVKKGKTYTKEVKVIDQTCIIVDLPEENKPSKFDHLFERWGTNSNEYEVSSFDITHVNSNPVEIVRNSIGSPFLGIVQD